MPAKNLADEPLGAIALDRAAHLLGGGDPQPRDGLWPVQQENRHVAAVKLAATIIDVLKIGPVPDVLAAPESLIRHACQACADGPPDWRGRGEVDGSVRRDRQPLAALGAATLQHDAAVLGPHPHEKPVRPAASAVVGLKRALHRSQFPLGRRKPASGPVQTRARMVSPLAGRANLNGSERLFRLSIATSEKPTPFGGSAGAVRVVPSAVCLTRISARLTPTELGFPPKVFHTCGKICGKPGISRSTIRAGTPFGWYFAMAKGVTALSCRPLAVTPS